MGLCRGGSETRPYVMGMDVLEDVRGGRGQAQGLGFSSDEGRDHQRGLIWANGPGFSCGYAYRLCFGILFDEIAQIYFYRRKLPTVRCMCGLLDGSRDRCR